MKTRSIVILVVSAVLAFILAAGAALFGLLMLLGGQAASGGSGGTCTVEGTGSELVVETSGGDKLTLGQKQLANAAQIIAVGLELGVSPAGIKVAMMTALQESKIKMLANSTVPGSTDFPNDGVGKDHDSVNMFQQRPHWGTLEELMNTTYAIKAFFGGPTGPNHGSPRGLLDIRGWESLAPGTAAQRVQVSAYPDAYDQWEGAAEKIISALGGGISCGGGGAISADAKALAQGLVDAMATGKLSGNDQALDQIRNMANGSATTSCTLDVEVLQVITYALQQFGTASVSSLNRRCINDHAGIGEASYHWKGQAVDFTYLGGVRSRGYDVNSLKFIKLLDAIIPAGKGGVGQYDCRADAGVPLFLSNFIQFDDGCDHLHLEFRQKDTPLNFPSA